MTRVQVKKELLRNVGNAKQCVLCGRVFSRESGAVEHVFTEHSDLCLAQPGGVGEQPSPATPYNALPAPPVVETRSHPKQPSEHGGWKCKFCAEIFKNKDETIPHLKEIHGILKSTARERSIKKV